MIHRIKNLLVTGIPGIGKTTLIKKLSQKLRSFEPAGFYTEEIKERNERKGFKLISLNGSEGILSHVDLVSKYRVSRYNIDIKGFEDFLDSIRFFNPEVRIIIIDEIGKMECLSNKFVKIIGEVLESEKIVISTISMTGGPIIDGIKKRRDVRIYTISKVNRDFILSNIFNDIMTLLT
ncbi:MAG: NTPase [Thermodesulfobacteriota bacterium]